MINNDIKKLLKEAHTAAEDLRIALDKQPEHIALADRVLFLIHLASHEAHSSCECEKGQNTNDII